MELAVAETLLRVSGEREFNRAMDNAERRVNQFGALRPPNAMDGFINDLGRSFHALGGAAMSAGALLTATITAPISAVAALGLEFNALRERAQIAFTGILGSSQAAAAFLKELAAFAAATPFEFPDLVKAAQRFAAIGIEAKAVIPIMTALGDAVAAAGGTSVEIERVTIQLTQMIGKGKVAMNDLRVIADSIPSAAKVMAEKLGISMDEMFKKMEDGALKASDGVRAMLTGLLEKFHGQMEAQSKTFSGLMSTLKDTARFAAADLTKTLFETLKGGLVALLDVLPKVVAFIGLLPKELILAGTAVAGFAAVIGPLLLVIGGLIALLGGPLTLALTGIAVVSTAMAAALALNFQHVLQIGGGFAGGMRVNMVVVAMSVGFVADAFTIAGRVIVGVFDALLTTTYVFAKAIIAALSQVANVITGISRAILSGDPAAAISVLADAFKNVKTAGAEALGSMKGLFERLKGGINDVSDHWSGKFANMFGGLALQAKAAGNFMMRSLKESLDEINAAMDKLKEQAGKAADKKGGSKKAKETFEGLNEETKKILIDWLGLQGEAVKFAAEIWNKLPSQVQEPLKRMATAFRLASLETQRVNLERLAEQATTVDKEKKIFIVSEEIYARWSERVKKAVGEVLRVVVTTAPPVQKAIDVMSMGITADMADTSKVVLKSSEEIVKALGAIAEEAPRPALAIEVMRDEIQAALGKDIVLAAEATLAIQDMVDRMVDMFIRIGQQAKLTGKDLTFFVDTEVRQALAKVPGLTKDMIDKLLELSKQGLIKLGGVWDDIFDRIGSSAKQWASDIFEIIKTIPGGFGDAARGVLRTVETWLQFADSVIRVLNRLGVTSMTSIGDLISRMRQAFSTGFQSILQLVSGFGTILTGIFANFSAMFGGGVLGSTLGGAAKGGLIGFGATQIANWLAGGAVFSGPIGALVGAGIGAAVGLFKGLFGGKSETQKLQEQSQKEQIKAQIEAAKQSIQKGAQEVLQAALQTMQQTMATLEKLADFGKVPKSVIQGFFKNLEQVINLFVELSKGWSKEMLAQAKEFAESVGPIVEVVAGGAVALQALSGFIAPARRSIDSFGRALSDTIDVFASIFDSFEKRTIKLARKLAEKSLEVVELVGTGLDAFSKFADFREVPRVAVQALGNAIELSVTMMMEVSDRIDKFLLKQAALASERMSAVVGLLGSSVESLNALHGFRLAPAEAFRSVGAGIQLAFQELSKVVQSIESDLLDGTARASDQLGKVVGLFAASLTAFKDLQIYTGAPAAAFVSLGTDLRAAIRTLADVAGSISADLVSGAAAFADRVGNSISLVGSAVSSLSGLASYGGAAAGSIGAFGADLRAVINLFGEIAGQISDQMIDRSAAFAQKMGGAISFIGESVGTLKSLFETPATTGPQINAFFNALSAVVSRMGDIANTIPDAVITAAQQFASRSGVVFGAIRDGVNTFNLLDSLKSIGQETINTFVNNFTAIVDALGRLVDQAIRAESFALSFDEHLRSAAEHIAAGVSSLSGAVSQLGSTLAAVPSTVAVQTSAAASTGVSTQSRSTTVIHQGGDMHITIPAGDPMGQRIIDFLEETLGAAGLGRVATQGIFR